MCLCKYSVSVYRFIQNDVFLTHSLDTEGMTMGFTLSMDVPLRQTKSSRSQQSNDSCFN